MNEKIGPINIENMGELGNSKNKEVFDECIKIMKYLEEYTENIIIKNKNNVKKLAKSLLKNETITYNDIKKILPKKLENSLKNINYIKK